MTMKKNDQGELFINRDISWLEFNFRVLEEAFDKGNPLLERLRFISIFSSNLDEFFMVRMAGITQQIGTRFQKVYKNYGYVPEVLLTQLDHRIRELVKHQYTYLNNMILPALRKEKIVIGSWNDLSASQQTSARKIFEKEILPILTPIAIDPSHPFPFLQNLGLELLIRLTHGKDAKERFAVLEVPPLIPRFIQLENSTAGLLFVTAEELIANNLKELFNGWDIRECSPFRLTRDMDFSIDEESIADLLSEMQIALQKKTRRIVIRLEVSSNMSLRSRKWLTAQLNIKAHQLYSVNGFLNLKAMFQLTALSNFPALLNEDMPPLPSVSCDERESMFKTIRTKGPFITHLPYESFNPMVRLIEEASEDPDVLAIKQTLYRVSGNSPVVKALIKAARNGKQVSVLVEIKARFDEENNINWARELDEAGAHVVYGIAGLKVHCKALMIIRREEGSIRRYVHLSTGNYNDKTARIYTDIGYFSDDHLLAADVAALFNVITGFSDPPRWNKLLVAPFTLREVMIFLIDREARLSTKENPGHIRIKINSLIDYEIIDHLYAAAKRHVKIDLIVRGICGINPFSLPKQYVGNIRVVSIVDRFLEHSRIYYFRNNGSPEYYMGSADLMPRNLRRRIEVLFPVDNTKIREELDQILNASLSDRRKGRRLIGPNHYSHTGDMGKYEKTRSQDLMYEFYKERYMKFRNSKLPGKGKLVVYERTIKN